MKVWNDRDAKEEPEVSVMGLIKSLQCKQKTNGKPPTAKERLELEKKVVKVLEWANKVCTDEQRIPC